MSKGGGGGAGAKRFVSQQMSERTRTGAPSPGNTVGTPPAPRRRSRSLRGGRSHRICACAPELSQDHPAKVTGNLSGVRNIAFTEGTHPSEGISPVCGCMHPPVDSWRRNHLRWAAAHLGTVGHGSLDGMGPLKRRSSPDLSHWRRELAEGGGSSAPTARNLRSALDAWKPWESCPRS